MTLSESGIPEARRDSSGKGCQAYLLVFHLSWLFCLFCLCEGQFVLFLRTENCVFKVGGWDIAIINLVSLVADSHARIVLSLLENPSYLGMHNTVMNSGSQEDGEATLKPAPGEQQWN